LRMSIGPSAIPAKIFAQAMVVVRAASSLASRSCKEHLCVRMHNGQTSKALQQGAIGHEDVQQRHYAIFGLSDTVTGAMHHFF